MQNNNLICNKIDKDTLKSGVTPDEITFGKMLLFVKRCCLYYFDMVTKKIYFDQNV